MIAAVNPRIITWARKRNNLTVEDLADRMGRPADDILKWESGETIPSYTNLEQLSSRHLMIPLAVFFFPEPPAIEEPIRKFRRLPAYELERLSADTLRAMRLAQAYQDSLRELDAGAEIARRIFRDVSGSDASVATLAGRVREYLGITLRQQFRFRGQDRAFKAWRHALEESGIFTFKDSLDDRFISGFCLLDDEFPIIFVNNSNAFARQTFTLFHELGHILFGVCGVTDADETYLDYMERRERLLEVACNRFAAEVLVPSSHFEEDIAVFRADGVDAVPRIAAKYSVSREVILRRLLDNGDIAQEEYARLAAEWNRDYLRTPSKQGRGDYYLTRIAYIGEGYARLALRRFERGLLNVSELASHLNVKSRHIDSLLTYLGS